GKCVSGDTLVPLDDGNLVPIEDLYEGAKLNNKESPVEDGYIINNPSLSVFSVNPYSLKIEKIRAQNIWKLKKDKLMRVILENGQEIKVTPEHPFFVLKPGNIIQKRADLVSPEDYLMIPKFVKIENKSHIRLELLSKIGSRKLFVKSEAIVEEAYCLMRKTFGSLEKAYQEMIDDAAWMTFRYSWKSNNVLPSTIILKLAEMNSTFAEKVESEKFSIKVGGRPIMFPEINQDFYEWLGLFYAEGHMDPKYVEFTNSEEWLLNRFSDLTKNIFCINNIVIKPDIRHPHIKNVIAANTSLVYFVEKALEIPKYKKSSHMRLPGWILQGSDDLIASFLRAYWEGDGSAELSHRVLEATTASERFARQHYLMLLRFGIIASIGKKDINGKHYYRVSVVGKDKLKTFQNSIGFLGIEKQKKLENLIAMNSQFERTELIPMQSEYLKNLRLSSGILQQDLANLLNIGPSLLSQYELGYYQVSIPIERIAELSIKLSSPFLETLASADVRWVKVRKIEEVINGEEWVYDFTIPGYHNFVANNFIVHNTTTLAKLANKLKKYNPVLAAADTFRAASIEQLEEHGRRLDMRVVKHTYGSDAAAVIFDAKKHAEATGSKLVLA
ncbi:MAG: LAGLIDADG family homing endonuclease, partial [Candidatus Aenigmatarchaeota archaeon]